MVCSVLIMCKWGYYNHYTLWINPWFKFIVFSF